MKLYLALIVALLPCLHAYYGHWGRSSSYTDLDVCRQIYQDVNTLDCGPGYQVKIKDCTGSYCYRPIKIEDCNVIGAVSCNVPPVTLSDCPGAGCSLVVNTNTAHNLVNVQTAGPTGLPTDPPLLTPDYIQVEPGSGLDPCAYILVCPTTSSAFQVSADGRFCLSYKYALGANTALIVQTVPAGFETLTPNNQKLHVYELKNDIGGGHHRYRRGGGYGNHNDGDDGYHRSKSTADAVLKDGSFTLESYEPFCLIFVIKPDHDNTTPLGVIDEITMTEGACVP